MKININNYALWGIVVIAISIIVIALCVIYVVRYYIKRKYNSIDKYNKDIANKTMLYSESVKQYNENTINSGIKSPSRNIFDKVAVFSKILNLFKKEK